MVKIINKINKIIIVHNNIKHGSSRVVVIIIFTPCKALNPSSGTLEEPVTNWSNLALLSSS